VHWRSVWLVGSLVVLPFIVDLLWRWDRLLPGYRWFLLRCGAPTSVGCSFVDLVLWFRRSCLPGVAVPDNHCGCAVSYRLFVVAGEHCLDTGRRLVICLDYACLLRTRARVCLCVTYMYRCSCLLPFTCPVTPVGFLRSSAVPAHVRYHMPVLPVFGVVY